MIKLFRVFYYAPDLLEFTSIANWALNRVNEYQFFSALDFAVTHRADTQYVGHRHPYRIFPELFFTSDVMKKVYDIKMGLSTTGEFLHKIELQKVSLRVNQHHKSASMNS